MKQIYLLILLLTFGFSSIQAQIYCPPSLGNQSTVSIIHFKITAGTCGDFPNSITIQGLTFNLLSCNGTNLKYQVVGPDVIDDPANFTVTFEPNLLTCVYVNGQLGTLSNKDNTLEQAVSIYPNPVNNSKLNIKIANHITAKVSLYSVTGKRVLSEQISNNDFKSINVSAINNGIYMLQIETEEASVTRKVVIMQ